MQRIIIFLLLIASINPVAASEREIRAIRRFVSDSVFRYGAVSVGLYHAKTGKPIYEHNTAQALIPASVTKLIATSAAIEQCGGDTCFTTTLYLGGDITSEGTLKGSLIIVGSGDPSLGSRFTEVKPDSFLNFFEAKLSRMGIRRVDGDVVAMERNDSPYGFIAPKMLWEDVSPYYGGGLSDLNVYDNNYQLIIGRSPEGEWLFSVDPPITGFKVTNRLRIWDKSNDSIDLYPSLNGLGVEARGAITANPTRRVIPAAMSNPSLVLAQQVEKHLRKRNIAITGEVKTECVSSQEIETMASAYTIAAQWRSPSLIELAKPTNFRSINHYAEAIGRMVSMPETVDQSSETFHPLLAYWRSIGVDTRGCWLFDGSGFALANRLPARFIAEVLIRMYNSPNARRFMTTIPRVGSEGTVGGLCQSEQNKGNIRLKSGSMEQVVTYAGYVTHPHETYVLVIMTNQYSGTKNALNKKIERLLYSIQ